MDMPEIKGEEGFCLKCGAKLVFVPFGTKRESMTPEAAGPSHEVPRQKFDVKAAFEKMRKAVNGADDA